MEKYTATLHVNANSEDVKFIGNVSSNSIEGLKKAAREKSRNWGNYGRIHVEENNTGRDFFVNA